MPTGFFASNVGIAIEKLLLKERQKGREDDEEDVRSYWMILKK
jgi:hypothetical protein